MKLLFIAVVCSILLLVILFFAPLLIGIWLHDIVLRRPHTLATENLPNGDSFRIIQYWNNIDFYNTEFLHITPDGTTNTTILDGDDKKQWRGVLRVNPSNRTATIILEGDGIRTLNW